MPSPNLILEPDTVLNRLIFAATASLLALMFSGRAASAQALPTAERSFRFEAFGAANGTWTNLSGGRNAGITAGVDLDLPTFVRWRPAVEVRGTYPIIDGQVDAQRNILGGVRLGTQVGERLFPYVDGFFGRGRIDYHAPGYQQPGTPVFYTISSSNVIAGGGGVEYRLSDSISAKADLQINHQQTPVTATGSLNSTSVNIGLAWRPSFRRRKGVSEVER